MNKRNLKQKLKEIFNSIKRKTWLIPTTLMLLPTRVFAEGSISTAEVTHKKCSNKTSNANTEEF